MEPLINILIRTSNQPNLFARCIKSVNEQTYKNIRVIVSYDQDVDYLPRNVETVRVESNGKKFFYNDYCNTLKSMVTEGWFFFLDTDDYLQHSRVLEQLAANLVDKPVIVQMMRHNKPKPMPVHMIRSGYIGLPCIVVPASAANVADVGSDNDNDDYRYIDAVIRHAGYTFVPMVLVGTDRRSHGQQVDMLSSNKYLDE